MRRKDVDNALQLPLHLRMRSSRLGDLCLEGGDFAAEIGLCVLGDVCQGYLIYRLDDFAAEKMGSSDGIVGGM